MAKTSIALLVCFVGLAVAFAFVTGGVTAALFIALLMCGIGLLWRIVLALSDL